MGETSTTIRETTRVQVVTDEQELLRLAPFWNELFARADRPFVSQSFEWSWCVWKNLMKGARLRCIFLWEGDRLVLVWPAAIVRHHRVWAAEIPIATPGDYVDFLAERSPAAQAYARLAWQRRYRKADLTLIGRVRESSLLHQLITSLAVRPVQRQPARYVDWDQFKDWPAYYRSLSGRRSIASRQRRLLERGSISFKETDTTEEIQLLSAWMFRHKEVWLAARGGGSPWLGSKSYERFLLSVVQELRRYGRIVAFALLLNDQVIAVQICVVGMARLIRLHDAYDEDYRKFSPQHILTVQVLERAYERGLIADFCFGAEPYKEVFLPANCPVEDFRIAISQFGRMHEFARSSTRRVRSVLRGIIANKAHLVPYRKQTVVPSDQCEHA